MRMKKSVVVLLMTLGFGATAQDVHFSQFMQSPLLVNPGLTGMIPANVRASVAYRSQWGSVTTPYRTFQFSGDMKAEASKTVSLGFGLNAYRDVAGDTKFGTTSAQVSVSSIVELDRNQEISVGIIGGILQKGMNPSDLQWDSQYQGGNYNAALGSNENLNLRPGIMPDISAGVVYHYHSNEGYMTANDQFNLKAGFAMNHINRPRMKFITADTLYSNFVGFAESQIGIGNSRWTLCPAVLLMFQGPSREITFGNLFRYRLQQASKITGLIKGAFLYAGAYYRMGDAINPVIMVEFDQYCLGISYDVNVSPLTAASNLKGGMEITFRFMTPNPYLYKGSRVSFR
jgi:type IX secretion system PorP/SprF family membrane protein